MGIWGKMPLLGVLCGLYGIYRGQTWCRLLFMANVSVYEGVDSILERIKSIFCQFNRNIRADSRLTSRLFALGSGYILLEGHTSRLFIPMHP